MLHPPLPLSLDNHLVTTAMLSRDIFSDSLSIQDMGLSPYLSLTVRIRSDIGAYIGVIKCLRHRRLASAR